MHPIDAKAGIVSVGKLGGAVAFAIARLGHWDELVLCDAVEGLAWTQAEDVRHGLDATALGEHGDRAVPVFSRAKVRAKPASFTPAEKQEILEQLRSVAARVIEVRGGTAFGPAGCAATLVHALVAHTPSLVPASVVLDGEYSLRDVAVGIPAVLGQGHMIRVEEWDLRSEEQSALQDAGHDLARFAEDAAIVQGLAVRHTSLERLAPPPAR